MLKTAINNAETTENTLGIDVLSDALNSMRITGSLLLNEEYTAPWAVSVPNAVRLARLLKMDPYVQIAAFHLVERGYIELKLENGKVVVVQAGEMVVCFSGYAHLLQQGLNPETLPIENILTGGENRFRPSEPNKVGSTSLICGVFMLRNTHLNPLFAALPPFLKISVSKPGGFGSLSGVASLLGKEINQRKLGSGYIIERYLEILCTEVVRSYVEMIPEQTAGWLSALNDPLVGRVIEMIHSQPGLAWSVQSLAHEVAISPSRFAARFSTAMGEPPMTYVAKWRMYVAGRLLSDSRQSVDQVAAAVGYESLAAFSRAFKRYMGSPPATWRSNQYHTGNDECREN